MISIIHSLGFLMEFKRGAKGKEELIQSFVHLESLRESMRMRFEAMVEESLGASIHGDNQQA
jgi:NAD kinase